MTCTVVESVSSIYLFFFLFCSFYHSLSLWEYVPIESIKTLGGISRQFPYRAPPTPSHNPSRNPRQFSHSPTKLPFSMYTLNDLSPTAKQTRLLSIPFPLWLISLTSFVVAYVLLALVRLVLVLQRQKPERDERYIRLYHQRIMMRDQGRESQIIAGMVLAVVDMPIEVCKTDASAPPPSVFREAEAETVSMG